MDDLISLSAASFFDDALNENDSYIIRTKIFNLLARRARLYTMGDSSSIRIEALGELLESICFTLELHLKETNISKKQIVEIEFDKLYEMAIKTVEQKIEYAKELYRTAFLNAPCIENISFKDTVKSLGKFFKSYDYRFFAHMTPCEIDYQLCFPVPENLRGIEYICEYLRRLIIENDFIKRFDLNFVIALLRSYCPDYKELLINLYEPVMTNAIGLTLAGLDALQLDITDNDRDSLVELFKNLTRSEAEVKLKKASEDLCDSLDIQNVPARNYMSRASLDLYPRINSSLNCRKLKGLFVSCKFG